MKIIFTSLDPFPQFEIREGDQTALHIKIDDAAKAFRIRSQNNRRVFFVSDELVKKTQVTTLLNEYSQQLGCITRSKTERNTVEIEIEGFQYLYRLKDNNIKEISLFRADNLQPVLSLEVEINDPSFHVSKYISYLLFSIAWFAFITIEQPLIQFA